MGWTSKELGFDTRQMQEIFSSPQLPDRLWGTPSPLYRRLFIQGLSGRGVKLTSNLHLVPRLEMLDSIPTIDILVDYL
jgi:hypothetical protein